MHDLLVFIAQWIIAPWAFIASCVAVGLLWSDAPLSGKEFAQISLGWPWAICLALFDLINFYRNPS